MNTPALKKEEPILFSLYQEHSTGKCFVKYPELNEREITPYEYNDLLIQKERIYESKINEPIMFEKRPSVTIEESFTSESTNATIEIYPSSDGDVKDFICGTCHGNLYYTEDCLVLYTFHNQVKHNGDFKKSVDAFIDFCRKKGFSLTICNVNSKLLASMRIKFPNNKLIHVNKTTVVFSN